MSNTPVGQISTDNLQANLSSEEQAVAPPTVTAEPDDQAGLEAAATVRPVQFSPFGNAAATTNQNNIDLLMDVELKLTAELGQARLTIREILALGAGSVIELNRLVNEPIEITVNNMLIAHGEVVVVDDKFGIRVLDIVSTAKRVASLM